MKGGTLFSGICAPEQAMKACASCKKAKPLTAFHRQPSSKDGRHTYCADCFNARYRGIRRRKVPSDQRRVQNLKARYGLTPAEYDAMLERQGGMCALCREAEPKHIDHDHCTGEVRGLLCHRCNIVIGGWDNPEFRAKALAYLDGGAK